MAFHVSAFTSWADHKGRRFTGFTSKADAMKFAATLPDPLIDVVHDGYGVVAARRAVPFGHQRLVQEIHLKATARTRLLAR